MREAVIGVIGLLILTILAAVVYQNQRRFHNPLITTTFQAVMLTDGTLVYGRVDHLGTNVPVLRDVLAVRVIEGPGSGQVRYEAVPRKAGPHGADHMILPVTSILYIEPVKPDSAIGQVLEKASGKLPT